jgi:hypothetical protein
MAILASPAPVNTGSEDRCAKEDAAGVEQRPQVVERDRLPSVISPISRSGSPTSLMPAEREHSSTGTAARPRAPLRELVVEGFGLQLVHGRRVGSIDLRLVRHSHHLRNGEADRDAHPRLEGDLLRLARPAAAGPARSVPRHHLHRGPAVRCASTSRRSTGAPRAASPRGPPQSRRPARRRGSRTGSGPPAWRTRRAVELLPRLGARKFFSAAPG